MDLTFIPASHPLLMTLYAPPPTTRVATEAPPKTHNLIHHRHQRLEYLAVYGRASMTAFRQLSTHGQKFDPESLYEPM